MRSRTELSEESQCPRCAGSGILENPYRPGQSLTCGHCSGSGLIRPPKFRVTCECGEKQPRWTTAYTADKWMNDHLRSHAPEEPEDYSR